MLGFFISFLNVDKVGLQSLCSFRRNKILTFLCQEKEILNHCSVRIMFSTITHYHLDTFLRNAGLLQMALQSLFFKNNLLNLLCIMNIFVLH